MPDKKLTPNEKNLMRRYLTWCYKTTKEELDKVDRYFTQIVADEYILKTLKAGADYKGKAASVAYRKLVDKYRPYMDAKLSNAAKKKYKSKASKKLNADYRHMANRLKAIEKTIVRFLGAAELKKIVNLYETEMTTRILQAREHA